MEFVKVIAVSAHGIVSDKWLNSSEIRYVEPCEFFNPMTGVKHTNCLVVKTREEFETYINLDDGIIVSDTPGLKAFNIRSLSAAKQPEVKRQKKVKEAFRRVTN